MGKNRQRQLQKEARKRITGQTNLRDRWKMLERKQQEKQTVNRLWWLRVAQWGWTEWSYKLKKQWQSECPVKRGPHSMSPFNLSDVWTNVCMCACGRERISCFQCCLKKQKKKHIRLCCTQRGSHQLCDLKDLSLNAPPLSHPQDRKHF